jgi:hypothetical protein
MSRLADAPSVLDVLRAEVARLREAVAHERAQRESLLDLIIAHGRLGERITACAVEQARQDARDEQRT